jgi:protein LTV1
VVEEEEEEEEGAFQRIQLSEKTGLPVAVSADIYKPGKVEDDDDWDGEYEDVVDRGNTRAKGETAEEKRSRKKAVKAERAARREEKRDTRGQYAAAIEKRTGNVNKGGADGSDVKAGNSVFRYA